MVELTRDGVVLGEADTTRLVIDSAQSLVGPGNPLLRGQVLGLSPAPDLMDAIRVLVEDLLVVPVEDVPVLPRLDRQVAAWLDEAEAVPVPIVWKPVLKDRDAIRAAVLAANADDACIGVIAWMHTFSPAKMWIAGIDALAEPLLQLHTQYSESLPWSTIDMNYMNLNQAAHGDREFGYILSRLGRPRKVVVGHAAQAVTRAKVATWARAASTA